MPWDAGRVQAGRLLGDGRRLSAGAGLVGSRPLGWRWGVLSVRLALPLSVALRVSLPLAVCVSAIRAHAGQAWQGLRVLGCPLWLCLCWGTVASWARLSGVMLGGRSGRRAHGKIHKYKAVSLAIFHPLKYLNDEQNH